EGSEPPSKGAAPKRVFETGEPSTIGAEEIVREVGGAGLVKSVTHVPLKGRNGMVGVLSLGRFEEETPGADDMAFLTQIGRQVAIAVENARTFGAVSE